ncbi:MAG: aldose 1-epimerase family protein [Ruminococcaceae bacterium]|nr:aldose 1-epimerase family protein [Oscillospiraceae bacterium]
MIYTLQNEHLTVKISTLGAEPLSAVWRADGTEFLWQRDPRYWDSTAPWLFPICSALYDDRYTYRGKTYTLSKHGFAKDMEFAASNVTPSSMRLTLAADDRTRASYPFLFEFIIDVALRGARLEFDFSIVNHGKEMMPATLGGHPGINVPLAGEGTFEDYAIEFFDCSPDLVVLNERFYDTGKRLGYPLRDGKYLPLSHDLFAIDGVFLAHVGNKVRLFSERARHAVTVEYPGAPYVGIWSAAANDTPFVCIEPWYGLPAFHDGVEDLEVKGNMFRIEPDQQKNVKMALEFS